jgi:hypothetical protein
MEGGGRGGCHVNVEGEGLRLMDLLERIGANVLAVPGTHHGSTDYSTWLIAAVTHTQGEGGERGGGEGGSHGSFAVGYTLGWEPYVVVNKKLWKGRNGQGLFDARFRLRGWDKASFVYELAALGYTFRTLYSVFLVHSAEADVSRCDEQVFGFQFCSVAAQTAAGGWLERDSNVDGGRGNFLGFILSLSKTLAERERERESERDREIEIERD